MTKRIRFVTASGSYERPEEIFFNENSAYEKVAIKVAISNGKNAEEIGLMLNENPNFKGNGKVSFSDYDKDTNTYYIGFSMPITKVKEQFDIDTGESLGEKEFTEDHSYLMIVYCQD